MKKLMLSTAILAAMTVGAVAQDASGPFYNAQEPDAIRASDFIGMRVYSSETAVDADAVEGADEGWNDIGEINDVILGHDGQVDAVLVDIGGFLGIGERQVALSMQSLKFVADDATADDPSDFFLVVNATQEQLEGAEQFQLGEAAMEEPAEGTTETAASDTEILAEEPADTEVAADTEAMTEEPAADTEVAADTEATTEEPAADTEVAADTEATTEEPAAEGSTDMAADTEVVTEEPATDMAADDTGMEPLTREGYTTAAAGELTTEMLTGARVYGSEDEDVGEVAELVLTEDGQITDAIIDVGGFLGIGEKPVAVALDDLQIMQNEDGSDIRVYVRMTQEELEALPRFEN